MAKKSFQHQNNFDRRVCFKVIGKKHDDTIRCMKKFLGRTKNESMGMDLIPMFDKVLDGKQKILHLIPSKIKQMMRFMFLQQSISKSSWIQKD
jgi:hypothetical protein